jgi:hypothetical protein
MKTDQWLVCADCHVQFRWTVGEQFFWESKAFPPPRRCMRCRQTRKRLKSETPSGREYAQKGRW